MAHKRYDRETVLYKLNKRRVRAKPNPKQLLYLETFSYNQVGIKLLGMIDFLKVPLKRKESKIRKLKKEEYSYFKNKSCDICKKPAKAYLLIKGQHFLKCDSKKCNLVIEVKTGSFKFSGQVLI